MEDIYRSLQHVDLSEETYQLLKEKILKRQLKPGQKISINDVAEGLGVSRTPVVVALQRLSGEGLVEIIPRRGTFVRGVTDVEVEEVFDVRQMIELYAVQHLLQNGKVNEFLLSIQPTLSMMESAVSGEEYLDYEKFMQGDQDFHLALVCQTENRRIIDIYRDLNVHMHVVRAHYISDVETARQTQREHAGLIEAFKQGDLEKAQEAINAHVTYVKTRIIQLIRDEGGQI